MYHHALVVLAGAGAHLAAGWVLCSDMALGKFLTTAKEKRRHHHHHKIEHLICHFLVAIVLSFATCIAISVFDKAQVSNLTKTTFDQFAALLFGEEMSSKSIFGSIYTVLFIWAGFILPIGAFHTVWCDEDWKEFFVCYLKELVCLIALAATVTYLC